MKNIKGKKDHQIKSIAVWLILTDGKNSGKVVLQKRSKKDGEKIQSFPFVCQSSFNGKLERGESIDEAIKREAEEELGSNFMLPQNLKLFDAAEYEFKRISAISYNFYAKISESDLEKIAIHLGAEPEFLFVGKDDLPNIKTIEEKTANPQKEIVLFEDQYKTLKKLLLLF